MFYLNYLIMFKINCTSGHIEMSHSSFGISNNLSTYSVAYTTDKLRIEIIETVFFF